MTAEPIPAEDAAPGMCPAQGGVEPHVWVNGHCHDCEASQVGTTQSFGDISNERQWEWDREIEILRDFIEGAGLDAGLVTFARAAADAEIREEVGFDEPPIGSVIVTAFPDMEGDVAERMSDGHWLVVGEEHLFSWAGIIAATDAPITVLRHGYGDH
jgi:hypothetical protein